MSPSGSGLRFIFRGTLPVSGKKDNRIGIEFTYSTGYVTLTGNIWDRRSTIEEVTFDFGTRPSTPADRALVDDDTNGRRLDLTDEQVVAEMLRREGKTKFEGWYYHQVAPPNWSAAFYRLVAALDRVSGSYDQVRRLALNAPLVLKAPPKGNKTRSAKALRTFTDILPEVRPLNDQKHAEWQRVKAQFGLTRKEGGQ